MKPKAGEFIKTDSGEVIYGSKAFINEIFKIIMRKIFFIFNRLLIDIQGH